MYANPTSHAPTLATRFARNTRILHNCGDNIFFDLLEDYPVAAISWASTLSGNPTLAAGQQRTKKAVIGGVTEKTTLAEGAPEQVAEEVSQAIAQTGGRRNWSSCWSGGGDGDSCGSHNADYACSQKRCTAERAQRRIVCAGE